MHFSSSLQREGTEKVALSALNSVTNDQNLPAERLNSFNSDKEAPDPIEDEIGREIPSGLFV